jgi:hypothetical protein
LAVCFLLAADSPQDKQDKKDPDKSIKEDVAGLPYSEGTVSSLSFVRTRPGLTNDYLKNLAANWRKVCEEAKKEGLILSYKVYLGTAANKDDWDVMLQLEYKNMAAMDGMDEKFEAIYAKIMGPQDKQREGSLKRNDLREILGEKIVREVILK